VVCVCFNRQRNIRIINNNNDDEQRQNRGTSSAWLVGDSVNIGTTIALK
jgi:hypothetical protein